MTAPALPLAVTPPPGAALSIPLSSWLLCESLIRWAGVWAPGEIDAAADSLQRSIVGAAAAGGLRGQAYWLACSLAAGGLLKFRAIGRREVGPLLRLGARGWGRARAAGACVACRCLPPPLPHLAEPSPLPLQATP